jgi:thiamine-monophosphate kinase
MSPKRGEQSGEERMIDRFFRPIARHQGALGLADDAAVLTPPAGHDLVLTADAVVADVHFFSGDPADLVAKKALRVNLSDLAAKGAKPLGALLTISLPASVGDAWLEDFARGLGEDCDQFDCPLLGGDMTGTGGVVTVSITAIGSVPAGTMVRRRGAKAGDLIVVTGTIGDAALGLKLRKEPEARAFAPLDPAAKSCLNERYLLPMPRSSLAEILRLHVSAALDISDGLVGDLAKLAAASGVGASIDAKRVPLSAAARAVLAADVGLIETILTGGDDYEIAATIPENRLASFREAAGSAGVVVTTIGRMEAGDGVNVTGLQGEPLDLKLASFSHF